MKQMDLPGVWQIGIIVPDAKKAVEKAEKLFGVKATHSTFGARTGYDKCNTKYYGEPTMGSGENYCFQLGGVEIEYISPIGDPADKSTWREYLNKNPEGGIHHIAWRTEDTEAAKELLASEGFEEVQEGWWDTGRYTYLECKDMGLMMELLQFFDKKD